MSLMKLKGNNKIIERLISAVKNSSISHAYIFEGDSTIDKVDFANNFIKAILCESKYGDSCEICLSCKKINHGNYEDLIYLGVEGNSIKDEAIEDLQNKIKKKPYSGDRNIVIIQDADTMTLRAQNRLLKTLEEPTIGTVIILLSENIEKLTQTILSRCIIFRLSNLQETNYDKNLESAISVGDMLLEGKPFYEVANAITTFTTSKEIASEFLDTLECWYRDLIISEYDQVGTIIFNMEKLVDINNKRKRYKKTKIYHAIKCIEETKNDLNRNLNINYSLKSMILKIIA